MNLLKFIYLKCKLEARAAIRLMNLFINSLKILVIVVGEFTIHVKVNHKLKTLDKSFLTELFYTSLKVENRFASNYFNELTCLFRMSKCFIK